VTPRLSSAVVPPGGFVFEQSLVGGGVTIIVGGSLDDVLGKVLEYREQNGPVLDPGQSLVTPDGVWGDYHAQVCSRYPWLCTGVREEMVVTQPLEGGPSTPWEMLYTRMLRWVDVVRTSDVGWVDQKTASDRALVCVGCPMNVAWETNCGPCNQNLSTLALSVIGGRRTALQGQLKGCRSFGTLQALAVWMSEPGGDEKYPAPSVCWRKQNP
jgi:hypothetical protein